MCVHVCVHARVCLNCYLAWELASDHGEPRSVLLVAVHIKGNERPIRVSPGSLLGARLAACLSLSCIYFIYFCFFGDNHGIGWRCVEGHGSSVLGLGLARVFLCVCVARQQCSVSSLLFNIHLSFFLLALVALFFFLGSYMRWSCGYFCCLRLRLSAYCVLFGHTEDGMCFFLVGTVS